MMSWGMSDEFDGYGHSLADYFDSLYMSYKLGVMKPNPDFFRQVMESERIDPTESVFVDDGPRNIEAGRKLGFHTVCPANGADWREELEAVIMKENNIELV